MEHTVSHLTSSPSDAAASVSHAPARRGRLTIDAPMRAFHWLFALSFVGAWITAESERWRDVHVTLGYAFGGLLVFRLVYGLIGPRQARLSMLWRRVSGLRDWLNGALSGQLGLSRLATLAMGLAMVLLLLASAPLVLSGYAGHIDWLGQEDALEEVHEFFANSVMALVLAHLGLIALLSLVRRKNIAQPMLTGRAAGSGPDLVTANHGWLAMLVIATFVGFIAWQLTQDGGQPPAASTEAGVAASLRENTTRAADDDDDGDDD